MATLTTYCRYPDDDEVTYVSYEFADVEAAEAARDHVLELVRAGGIFHLPGDETWPMPFHADTVAAVAVKM